MAWRPTSLWMFDWFQALGIGGIVDAVRRSAGPLQPYVPAWIVYSLPNALWAYAFCATFASIWKGAPALQRYGVWGSLTFVIGSTELFQHVGWLPGTFDVLDLATVLAATSLTLPLFLDTHQGTDS